MSMPTYRQIEAFKAVMEVGRVTDAANKLHLSQPAVSKLLANLELVLGLQLFSGSKKRLTPTAEAQALLREINKVFVGIQAVTRLASELRNMRIGELTIVSVAAFGQRHVPRVIAEFLKKHDSVNIGLHLRNSLDVADWTASQKADIGISMMPVDHPAVSMKSCARLMPSVSFPSAIGCAKSDSSSRMTSPAKLSYRLRWMAGCGTSSTVCSNGRASPEICVSAPTGQLQFAALWPNPGPAVSKRKVLKLEALEQRALRIGNSMAPARVSLMAWSWSRSVVRLHRCAPAASPIDSARRRGAPTAVARRRDPLAAVTEPAPAPGRQSCRSTPAA
ncbi:MAG: LysR family transcriptional regulator [Betaproteobacteria bacterium]|nr:LysR family transcriptional regulator [Betaproteobacteria bacterium]